MGDPLKSYRSSGHDFGHIYIIVCKWQRVTPDFHCHDSKVLTDLDFGSGMFVTSHACHQASLWPHIFGAEAFVAAAAARLHAG